MKISIIFILLILTNLIFAQSFSINNISNLPKYEKYVFKATGSTLQETEITIEYKVKEDSSNGKLWIVRGRMPINNVFVDEEYTIRLKDLNILKYRRTQTFKRGKNIMSGEFYVDNKSNSSDYFIINTLQGLMYILRTFPFDKNKKLIYVRTPQQKKKKFNLKVKNNGKKTIQTKTYGKVETYNIDVSLSIPIIEGFLPSLDYYFKDDSQKTLIAMKGAFGMTGKKMEVELVKYIKEN